MLTALVLCSALAPAHIVGEGGLISPPVLTLTVGRHGDEDRHAVHGPFPWEYGAGIEEMLDDEQRKELLALRQRRIALSAGAAACVLGGSAMAFLGLYLTPNFVNVATPDPGGLTIPIILASLGLAIEAVAIPLVIFRPGDYEIETLVHSYNSSHEGDDKIMLVRELVGESLLSLSAPGAREAGSISR